MRTVTCVAPVNIAVIKYWGKRDEDLILPINDSLSATLSTENMCAKTTIMASPNFKENKFWLNGKEETLDNRRLQNCLKEIKKRSNLSTEVLQWNIHICSENNFPTAAGLASSAAGYSCLVYALSKLYKVTDISGIARQGSGSACRSVLGGWVQWHKGCLDDGTDSIVSQVAVASHWPEMHILVLVVNDSRKKYSSTSAMKTSVLTSTLLKHRAEVIVPQRINSIKDAILNKDFEKFAEITMQDSNQFHAVCLDTYPPCVYLNDVSHAIFEMVHAYNEASETNKIAYTFDAGPNACLFLLENDIPQFMTLINQVFPTTADYTEYIKGLPIAAEPVEEHLKSKIHLEKQKLNSLKYIIHTRIGNGPKILDDESLLNEAGYPKKT